ncbi:MAG: nuclear transport factor 2 family protein [Deltaproteobacteria bacterium]|nr:nuclear transport factor 2 family protein [Deltaproteobacteria bacterium]
MTIEELAARIQVLEDIEAIRKLKATYCYLCDAGLGDEGVRDQLLAHFTADAKVDFGLGPASIYEGREGLQTFFGSVVPGAVSFCMHMVHNPIIEVHGDRATGTWYYEAPTTDAASNIAQWMAGTYEEEYVRAGGCWKFAAIKTRWKYISPYHDGWAKNRGELLAALGAAPR